MSEDVTHFTDEEYRILLSALSKEKKVCCERTDIRFPYKMHLISILESVEDKIRKMQYGYDTDKARK